MRIFSLEGKLAGALVAWSTLTALSVVVLARWLDSAPMAAMIAVLGLLMPGLLLARRLASPVARLIRALVGQRVGIWRWRFQFFDPQYAAR